MLLSEPDYLSCSLATSDAYSRSFHYVLDQLAVMTCSVRLIYRMNVQETTHLPQPQKLFSSEIRTLMPFLLIANMEPVCSRCSKLQKGIVLFSISFISSTLKEPIVHLSHPFQVIPLKDSKGHPKKFRMPQPKHRHRTAILTGEHGSNTNQPSKPFLPPSISFG